MRIENETKGEQMKNDKTLDVAQIVSNAVSSMEQKVYGPLDTKLRELSGDDLDAVHGARSAGMTRPTVKPQLPPRK
jgi:hypothetical protein